MRHISRIVRLSVVFFSVVLMSCGGDEPSSSPPQLDPFTPKENVGNPYLQPHPDKGQLGNAVYCDTWREALADEISSPAPWGLPRSSIVAENVNGFFATQYPIDGINYYPCVLADIFAEIPLHVEVLREAYFGLAPEAQLARSELAQFLAFLYEEELTVPLLLDIAVQPVPEFSAEYVEFAGLEPIMQSESVVRVTAVLGISNSAPHQGDRQVWLDALFEVVARCEMRGVALAATSELKQRGVTRTEFEERMQSRLSEQDFSYLLEHGW